MNKIILKISIMLLVGILAINIIANSSYAKYHITESLEAINMNISLQNEGYGETQIIL